MERIKHLSLKGLKIALVTMITLPLILWGIPCSIGNCGELGSPYNTGQEVKTLPAYISGAQEKAEQTVNNQNGLEEYLNSQQTATATALAATTPPATPSDTTTSTTASPDSAASTAAQVALRGVQMAQTAQVFLEEPQPGQTPPAGMMPAGPPPRPQTSASANPPNPQPPRQGERPYEQTPPVGLPWPPGFLPPAEAGTPIGEVRGVWGNTLIDGYASIVFGQGENQDVRAITDIRFVMPSDANNQSGYLTFRESSLGRFYRVGGAGIVYEYVPTIANPQVHWWKQVPGAWLGISHFTPQSNPILVTSVTREAYWIGTIFGIDIWVPRPIPVIVMWGSGNRAVGLVGLSGPIPSDSFWLRRIGLEATDSTSIGANGDTTTFVNADTTISTTISPTTTASPDSAASTATISSTTTTSPTSATSGTTSTTPTASTSPTSTSTTTSSGATAPSATPFPSAAPAPIIVASLASPVPPIEEKMLEPRGRQSWQLRMDQLIDQITKWIGERIRRMPMPDSQDPWNMRDRYEWDWQRQIEYYDRYHGREKIEPGQP